VFEQPHFRPEQTVAVDLTGDFARERDAMEARFGATTCTEDSFWAGEGTVPVLRQWKNGGKWGRKVRDRFFVSLGAPARESIVAGWNAWRQSIVDGVTRHS
jgi:hypothetical protein